MLPQPEFRLKLGDRQRLKVMVRRFAPATCIAMPARSRVTWLRSGPDRALRCVRDPRRRHALVRAALAQQPRNAFGRGAEPVEHGHPDSAGPAQPPEQGRLMVNRHLAIQDLLKSAPRQRQGRHVPRRCRDARSRSSKARTPRSSGAATPTASASATGSSASSRRARSRACRIPISGISRSISLTGRV